MTTKWIVGVALVVATLVAYAPVVRNGFVLYDDPKYVTANGQVRDGLTLHGLRWAWTTGHASNWHPTTWMSHMLDEELFGSNPAGHHLSSLLLHAINTLLLFLLFERMTGSMGRSALVAALFGLHPLHVESVAWVAERKDVLSTFFWFLTTLAYVAWTQSRTPARYVAVVAAFAVGLTAKPMLVTLPFTLLLVDVWPLERSRAGVWPLVREKIPLFALSAASCLVTLFVQRAGGAVGSLDSYPLETRIANALVSIAAYLRKTVWPSDLAVCYPYPRQLPETSSSVAALFVVGLLTALVVRERRRRPYLLGGWLWFLGTLVPVLGLVQVGLQSMADRYTYVPLVGVFVMVAWGLPDVAPRRLAIPAAGVLLAFAATTSAQVRYWRDSKTLFAHALAVTSENSVAEADLGIALGDEGRLDDAVEQFRKSLRIRPGHAPTLRRLGLALDRLGRDNEALEAYNEAVRSEPDFVEARNELGLLLVRRGNLDEAIEQYRAALQQRPDDAATHQNLGKALMQQGKEGDARAELTRALALDPYLAAAHAGLGRLLEVEGKTREAIEHYETAIRIDPDDTTARAYLEEALRRAGGPPAPEGALKSPDQLNDAGVTLARAGRVDEAIDRFREAIVRKPDLVRAHVNLGLALESRGRAEEGAASYRRALELDPNDAEAHASLGAALAATGRYQDAIDHYESALRARARYPEALNNYGSALIAIGRADDACDRLRKAIALRPDYAKAHFNLAVALFTKESHAEAWVEVRVAQRLGFDPPERFLRMLAARMPEPAPTSAPR